MRAIPVSYTHLDVYKRQMYENLFRDQLNEVTGEFSTLQGLSQALQIRVNSSLLKKCA